VALGCAQVLGGAQVKPIGPFAMTRAPGGSRVAQAPSVAQLCPSARWSSNIAQARHGRVQPTLGLGVDAAILNFGVGVVVSGPTWG